MSITALGFTVPALTYLKQTQPNRLEPDMKHHAANRQQGACAALAQAEGAGA